MKGFDIKTEALLEYARKSGASGAVIVSPRDIPVENHLAAMCENGKCENFGLSKSCPPHVAGPEAFKNQLKHVRFAVFFKIDVPSEILYSSQRGEIFRLLHETAAGIEDGAEEMGLGAARGYAGGSCKQIFCSDYKECLVVSGKGECRNPGHARPSMSGFGVNVSKLMERAGWSLNESADAETSGEVKMASVCGLVLIGSL